MQDRCLVAIEPLPIGGELVSFILHSTWSRCNLVPSATEKAFWCELGQHQVPQKQCNLHKSETLDSSHIRQYLRLAPNRWYSWPFCSVESSTQWHEKEYDCYKVRQKYTQFAKTGVVPEAVSRRDLNVVRAGIPTRCIFCHEDLETALNVRCSKCESAMHISCAKELTACPCES